MTISLDTGMRELSPAVSLSNWEASLCRRAKADCFCGKLSGYGVQRLSGEFVQRKKRFERQLLQRDIRRRSEHRGGADEA